MIAEHFCERTRLAFAFPYSIVILCVVGLLVLTLNFTLTFTLHPSPFTLHLHLHTPHTHVSVAIHAQKPYLDVLSCDHPQALVGRGGWLVQGAADPCVTGWDLVWYLRSMLAELSSSGERNRKYRWSLDARNQYLPD